MVGAPTMSKNPKKPKNEDFKGKGYFEVNDGLVLSGDACHRGFLFGRKI